MPPKRRSKSPARSPEHKGNGSTSAASPIAVPVFLGWVVTGAITAGLVLALCWLLLWDHAHSALATMCGSVLLAVALAWWILRGRTLLVGADGASGAATVYSQGGVDGIVGAYTALFTGARTDTGAISSEAGKAVRADNYKSMVDKYYTLVTDFYEYGWGQSFHFAPRFKGEGFTQSIARAEHFLAARLGLRPGMRALDLGCGVGGPLRAIARFSGAAVEGITINQYQVTRGNQLCAQMGLDSRCHLTRGDFMELPFGKSCFDAAYQIEATVHAPDRTACFREVSAALKPGALFAGYEWVMTPAFDASNSEHVRIKEGIEVGNGLPAMTGFDDVLGALEKAGFEVIESYDANSDAHSELEVPWYEPLDGRFTPSGFRMTRLGRALTHIMVSVLEALRIAPKGSVKVSQLLNATADDLVSGGKLGIFTPTFYYLARKK
eukprot:g40.t1